MKKIQHFVRSDLRKPKTFQLRNFKNVLETPQTQPVAQEVIPTLERSPKQDFCDFSTEENGFYRIGDKIVEVIFPR